MEELSGLTADQRTVLLELEVGDLLLMTVVTPGAAVDGYDEEYEEEYDEEDQDGNEDNGQDDGMAGWQVNEDEDEDANSVVTVLGPADVPLPALSDDEDEGSVDGSENIAHTTSDRHEDEAAHERDDRIENTADLDEDDVTDESDSNMHTALDAGEADRLDESDSNMNDASNGSEAEWVDYPSDPQVYVVASVSKFPDGALTSLILTPITYSRTFDPDDHHTFRIFGPRTEHNHPSTCTDCPAPLAISDLSPNSSLTRNPSGDHLRTVLATSFPMDPHSCDSACFKGFLPTPSSVENLFSTYVSPLLTHLQSINASTTDPLATLQPIVCPVCIGFDLFQEQQELQTTLLQTSWVDITDAIAFLSRLNPRRKAIGLPFEQFDEREWGFLFEDMVEDDGEDGEDEDGDAAANDGRWQQWDEAMDPNAVITKRAAPEEIVAALPRSIFGDTSRAKEAMEGEVLKCRICLEQMCAEQEVIVLPCGHSDCEECIVEWLKARDSCHVCRTGVTKGDDAEGGDMAGENDGKGEDGCSDEKQQVIVDVDGDVEMGEDSDGEGFGSPQLSGLIAAAAQTEQRLAEAADSEN